MSWRFEKATFHQPRAGGPITVDKFPDRLLVAVDLIEQADPAFLSMEGDLLTITVANGRAVYRVVEYIRFLHTYEMVAVEREWHHPLEVAS